MDSGIEVANIYLTEDCNLRCDYCYEKHNHKAMNGEMMDAVIKFCCDQAHDKFRFWLFGGEPFLVEDHIYEFVSKAIQASRDRKIAPQFNVLSNGTVFSKTFAEFWKVHGCIALQVSLDGIAASHDQHRKTKDGKPTFAKIVDNITEYLKYRRDLHVRFTVMPDTAKFLYESIDFIVNLGVRSFSIMPVHEVEWKAEEIKIYHEQFKNVVDLFVKMIQQKEKVFFSNVRLNYPGEHYQDIPCGAGSAFVAITPEGDIYPCHRFVYLDNNRESFKIGNVLEGFDSAKRKPFQDIRIARMKGCSSCAVKNCSRCIAMNWLMNGDLLDSTRKGYCGIPGIHDEAAVKVYNYLTTFYQWAKDRQLLDEYPFVKKLIEENDYCVHV
jgi:uncharacterized protein